MHEGFNFPDVRPGQIVMYATSPQEQQWHPMLVVKVGGESIDGIVYWDHDQVGASQPRSGCRHVADPWLSDVNNLANLAGEDSEGGCFVEHPDTLEARNRIGELSSTVESLEETLAEAIKAFNAMAPEESQLAAPAAPKRGRPKKQVEDAAPAQNIKLSDFIGGGGPPAKVNEDAKRAALASAR